LDQFITSIKQLAKGNSIVNPSVAINYEPSLDIGVISNIHKDSEYNPE